MLDTVSIAVSMTMIPVRLPLTSGPAGEPAGQLNIIYYDSIVQYIML